MGDRRNVVVDFDNGTSVALYTHWSGSELEKTLAAALNRGRDRWQDADYLARIIFEQMVAGDPGSTTGYGIAPHITGSGLYCEASPDYDLNVDISRQMVHGDLAGEGSGLSFDEFVEKYTTS